MFMTKILKRKLFLRNFMHSAARVSHRTNLIRVKLFPPVQRCSNIRIHGNHSPVLSMSRTSLSEFHHKLLIFRTYFKAFKSRAVSVLYFAQSFSFDFSAFFTVIKKVHETHAVVPDMVFRSTYFLDILGLPDVFSEEELENAVLNQVEEFMHEMGSDFTLVERQKRITIDSVDYKMDLVFFHRTLRRFIVVDLKLGKFKPAYEGQMLLYLRYLNAHEKHEWEESPIGLILCSEGNTEHIEYLMLDESSPIKVAQYYTQLPDKKVLAERLQRAIAIAKEYQAEKKLNQEKDER